MSLSDRHRWCVSKILEAFGPELTSEAAQAFIRQDGNIQKFNSFFKGDGPGRLFVFYQPDLGDGETWTGDAPGPKQLSLSDGSAGLMVHKCCYFIRNVPSGAALDVTKSGDTDLLVNWEIQLWAPLKLF